MKGRGRALARLFQLFLNRMFSLWGWFCSEKVYPQIRRVYYLFFYYYMFFTTCMSRCFTQGIAPVV